MSSVEESQPPIQEQTHIERIEANSLDQLIQIFEISFIFLLTFIFITLIDTALKRFNIYDPISTL